MQFLIYFISQAYKRGMMRSGYVWMIYDWYDKGWWKQTNQNIECTIEQMDEAINSSTIFTLSRTYFDTSGKPTVSGWVRHIRAYKLLKNYHNQSYIRLSFYSCDVIVWLLLFNLSLQHNVDPYDGWLIVISCPPYFHQTTEELMSQLKERFKWPENKDYRFHDFGAFGYDAAWAVALMLNKSVEVLKEKVFSTGEKRRLQDFNYNDSEMAQLFLDMLNQTSFNGMSVSLR